MTEKVEGAARASVPEAPKVHHMKRGDGTVCGAPRERGNSYYEWAYVDCPACRTALGERSPVPDPTAALGDELERERMRLAACMSAALGNTPESVAQRLTPEHPYWSASYGDVCLAVDREMGLRATLLAQTAALQQLVDEWREEAADTAEREAREHYTEAACSPEYIASVRRAARSDCECADALAALIPQEP